MAMNKLFLFTIITVWRINDLNNNKNLVRSKNWFYFIYMCPSIKIFTSFKIRTRYLPETDIVISSRCYAQFSLQTQKKRWIINFSLKLSFHGLSHILYFQAKVIKLSISTQMLLFYINEPFTIFLIIFFLISNSQNESIQRTQFKKLTNVPIR